MLREEKKDIKMGLMVQRLVNRAGNLGSSPHSSRNPLEVTMQWKWYHQICIFLEGYSGLHVKNRLEVPRVEVERNFITFLENIWEHTYPILSNLHDLQHYYPQYYHSITESPHICHWYFLRYFFSDYISQILSHYSPPTLWYRKY